MKEKQIRKDEAATLLGQLQQNELETTPYWGGNQRGAGGEQFSEENEEETLNFVK